MKYISTLDIEDLVSDFREDYLLTPEMETELRAVAQKLDRALVNYANSNPPCNPEHDCTASVFWINSQFYADADFNGESVKLDCPTLENAADELGLFDNEGENEVERLIDSVNWFYYWSVKGRRLRPFNVAFKESAMTRVMPFLEEFPDAHSAITFSRAMRAIAQRHSDGVPCPAAVVAFYDGQVFYRLFDDLQRGFVSYLEFKAENAPCVLLSMKSLTTEKGSDQ